MKQIINLLRVRQWYKNLVVFLALFFSESIFNLPLVLLTLKAFVALCLLSATNYIINDIVDRKKDQFHPEKRLRPIASGKISILQASALSVLTLGGAIAIAHSLNKETQLLLIVLFVVSQLYNAMLKKIAFADIITISTLFVIRAIVGAAAISVTISPWLILCPFFLALYLAAGKRHADMLLLKEKSTETRPALKEYSVEMTTMLIAITTTLLVLSYALFSFLSEFNYLLWTLPFALMPIIAYTKEILQASALARHPEKVFKNKRLITSISVWVIATYIAIYIL